MQLTVPPNAAVPNRDALPMQQSQCSLYQQCQPSTRFRHVAFATRPWRVAVHSQVLCQRSFASTLRAVVTTVVQAVAAARIAVTNLTSIFSSPRCFLLTAETRNCASVPTRRTRSRCCNRLCSSSSSSSSRRISATSRLSAQPSICSSRLSAQPSICSTCSLPPRRRRLRWFSFRRRLRCPLPSRSSVARVSLIQIQIDG